MPLTDTNAIRKTLLGASFTEKQADAVAEMQEITARAVDQCITDKLGAIEARIGEKIRTSWDAVRADLNSTLRQHLLTRTVTILSTMVALLAIGIAVASFLLLAK